MIEALLTAGADVGAQTEGGDTPLKCVGVNGNRAGREILVEFAAKY